MGDENPIRTRGDYFKPSHEGYRNTIELSVRNNVVPLRSDTIRLGKNASAFVSIFPTHQASDWLERLPAGSISTWEDLTTRFLAQFFPPGRTAKLRNDILMFQQHHGESLSEAWNRFKDLLQKVPHHGIDLWLQIQIFYDHVNPITRRTIDQSAGGKLRDLNLEVSLAILEDLALYDNESWNDPRDFAKLVKAIALLQGVPSTSDRRLIELENQNCIENSEQAFVEYASSRIDEAGGEMTNKIDAVLKAIIDQIAGTLPSDTVKNPKLGTHLVSSAHSYPTRPTMLNTRNLTYIVDFMIVEDISSIINPRLSQVVLGRPFVEISNMTHDPTERVVRFVRGSNEVAYKMPHKIEQYNSLWDI
uniref:Zinc finger, CCHC-type n=1 Tax=Tanacetum cinerariifolium TaxID=118510 RepID=A0A6L2NJP2_TANCI|nr:zinc finger, CCHC-type [Tanacetum cinerariifolium]